MRKVTLLLPLETPEGTFPKGATVELPEKKYEWLMSAYAELRVNEVKKLEEAKAFVEKIEKVIG